MQISWLGLSAFEINTKNQNGEVVLITDPYDNQSGLRFPRTLEGHLVLTSHHSENANNVSAITGHPYVINMPGEFEVHGVFVFGMNIPLAGNRMDHTMYRLEMEGMSLAHLGVLDRVLTDEELKQLSQIDILMIPVGGNGVLTPAKAADVVAQIEPRVVIPMMYQLPNLKTTYETVEVFCKAMGACRREEVNKYKVTRKDLPADDLLIVTLSR